MEIFSRFVNLQLYQYIVLSFFPFLISFRALQALPANFDPVPKEITQEFGLLCLFDVSNFASVFIDVFIYFLGEREDAGSFNIQ